MREGRVAAIHRFPVKALSAEPMARLALEQDAYAPGDRLYAIEDGPSGFDPAAPRTLPKIRFLTLMRQPALATLRTRFDHETHELTIARDGETLARGRLSCSKGREAIERFLTQAFETGALAGAVRGPLRVLSAPQGFRFADSASGFVSIVNRATLEAVAAALGAPLDPLRMRANVLIEGVPAFDEHGWAGRAFALGDARLEGIKRTDRCAVTAVDPQTGARDRDLPGALMRAFGHIDCGLYARVAQGGLVCVGDAARLL